MCNKLTEFSQPDLPGRLLAIENSTFAITKIHNNKNSIIVSMNNFSMNKSDCDQKYTFVIDLPMPINIPVCCDKNIVIEILMWYNYIGMEISCYCWIQSRRCFQLIWKLEILDISSVICANSCNYLLEMRLDSYFFMGSSILSMTLTFVDNSASQILAVRLVLCLTISRKLMLSSCSVFGLNNR